MYPNRVSRACAALCVLLLGVTACSSSTQRSASSSAQFSEQPLPTDRPTSDAPLTDEPTSTDQPTLALPAPKGDELTGLGALDAAWDASHRPDQRFEAGSVYDRDPTVNTISGNGDKYIAVTHGDGRVLSYSVEFPSGTARADAIAEVSLEFPTDVGIVWQKQLDSCYQVEFHSATLAKDVPSSDISHGYMTAEFLHYDSQASPLPDTSVLDEMIFTGVPAPTPSGAAC